jgi:transketolase C-terminal domain/subunit
MVPQALEAAAILQAQGKAVNVIHPSVLSHPDVSAIKTCLEGSNGKGIVIEDHQEIGGFGHRLAGALHQAGVKCELKFLGVQGEFGRSAYTADQLYALNGIDTAAILKAL